MKKLVLAALLVTCGLQAQANLPDTPGYLRAFALNGSYSERYNLSRSDWESQPSLNVDYRISERFRVAAGYSYTKVTAGDLQHTHAHAVSISLNYKIIQWGHIVRR